MPLFNQNPDDELITDGSRPVNGVNNSQPPSAIPATSAEEQQNRLAQLDGLNRPRPGIIRLKRSAGSLDSIHHMGQGVFLANDAATWYKYDYRGNVFGSVSGGPVYAAGTQVYSALSNATLYFSDGSDAVLHKYSVAGGFATVVLPTNGPSARYPIWALVRLIYAYKNTLIISDVADPEVFDVITGSVTLDPIASDVITGQALWQNQAIAVFRNGSTWMVETGPGLDVPDWSINRVSATVGCRSHGTIVQCGADVLFLSETGRGVYALSQAPNTSQIGVWTPISIDVQDYINRINWSAADCARATYWNDLYILSVPLDNSIFNNYCLIYSMSLQTWQGSWCFDIGSADVAVRDFARDRTDPNQTVLLLATKEGIISRQTYPVELQYFDKNIDGTTQLYDSLIRSRAFIFSVNISEQYTTGASINQIRPHSARFQFLESVDPVQVKVIADRTIELLQQSLDTSGYRLSLTIPKFPFDLDTDGYKNAVISLLGCGVCTEIQFELEGTGAWILYQIKTSAFETMPLAALT